MAEEGKVSFKKSAKKRPARSKAEESPSEDEEINTTDFEKTKQLQRLRKRTAGTNIVTLALGKKISKIDQDILEDPFQLNSGGLVLMKDMKGYKTKQDAYDVGTQFYKETHIRDEDDEMKRFIDTEMEKIKGVEDEVGEEEDQPKYLSPEDAALQALPGHLTKSTFKKDQQMLSAQMLTGIPEVDLGIEVKIQNIERTERAKKLLMQSGKLSTGQMRNTNSSHERFTSSEGSLGSDGRFEPNMFGTAATRWEDQATDATSVEEQLRRDMLSCGPMPRDVPEGMVEGMRNENSFTAEATDEDAVKRFKAMEENDRRMKGRQK